MNTYDKHLHFKQLGASHPQCKAGFIFIGHGNALNPLCNFWNQQDIHTASGRNDACGKNPEYKYYVQKNVWYAKFYSDIFTHSNKCIIGRITTKFKNGLLSLNESLNELKNRIGKEFVMVYDMANIFILPEFANFDKHSKRYYSRFNNFISVIVDFSTDTTEYWHENNIGSNCFFCNHDNHYYDANKYTMVRVEGFNVCLEANEGGIFTWEDGSLHWVKEHNYVPDYHTITRKWEKDEINNQVGVELEIYSPNRGLLNNALPKEEIFGETDGSLCPFNGIELIGKPYYYSDYISGKTQWNKVFELAINYGSYGFNVPNKDYNYGMHVSLSRNMFSSKMHLAKFVVFFNMQEELCKLVAQRDTIYSGNYKIRQKIVNGKYVLDRKTPALYLNRNPYALNTSFYFDTGKYEAVSVFEKRVECRIFNSTLTWERFLKNIEFCVAVKDYTEGASGAVVEDENRGTKDFIQWLFKQPYFSNLKRFLNDSNNHGIKVDEVMKKINHRFSPLKNKKVIDNR